MIEILNVFSVVTRVRWQMVIVTIITISIYMGSIIMCREYFQVSAVDGKFMLKVVFLTTVAWLPLHLLKKVL